jgi:hypothetical protein
VSYDTSASGDKLTGQFSSAFDTPFSIVVWAKRAPTDWNNTSDEHFVQLNDDETDNGDAHSVHTRAVADNVAARSWTPGGTARNAEYNFADGTYDDTWVCIIGVWVSDTDRRIYIENSSNVGTNTEDDSSSALVDYIAVGGSTHSNFQQLDGLLAEVAIFDKALSTAEIDALQTASETGPPPNSVAPTDCIGYWPMKIDQSTHADQSGNGGPTLTVQSSAPWSSDHPTIVTGTINTRTLTDVTNVSDPADIATLTKERASNSNVDLLADAIFLHVAHARLMQENLSLNDQYVIEQNLQRALANTVSMDEALAILRKSFREVSEIVSLDDALISKNIYGRIQSDLISFTDTDRQSIARQQRLVDEINATDFFQKTVTVGLGQKIFAVLLDQLVVIDNVVPVKLGTIVRQVTDTIAVDEFIALSYFRQRLLAEGVSIEDATLVSRRRNQIDASDSIGVTDANDNVKRRARELSDNTLALVDNLATEVIKHRTLFINLEIDEGDVEIIDFNYIDVTDNVIAVRAARHNSETLSDSIGVIDFIDKETGTLKQPAVCIDHGIEAQ